MAITIKQLQQMKLRGEKITCLTCYDASFARLMHESGLDVLLVGDSLGMVIQGESSTLPVDLAQMEYHTRAVARSNPAALIVADLPFGSYQISPAQAFESAARLMAAGAQMVKLEGGAVMSATVEFLVARGIPVCGHLGLTPQSVHQLSGYRVQGKEADAAERILQDAQALQQAGASLLVLEMLPSALAARISQALSIPTIGIGAGPATDGQVLVLYDMLGIYGTPPRFSQDFLAGQGSIKAALSAYVAAVKTGDFPAPQHEMA